MRSHATTSRRPAAPRAFTLIELLVVVGIIAALIAILIPSLGRMKNNSRASATQALLTTLSNQIDAYYATFQAYPGPMHPNLTAGTAAPTKPLSGAQNLLLGLSFAMKGVAPPINVQIPNTLPPVYVDPTNASGPINYAAQQPDGTFLQMTPFFTPKPDQLSKPSGGTTWPPTGFAAGNGAPAGQFNFPVLVDAFPDPLPILYYRRSRGIDTGVGPTPLVGTNPSAGPFPYYFNENAEYTNASSQSAQPLTAADVQAIVKTADSPVAAPIARGGYLLMAAGIDRLYGKTTDNQILVGGN